MAYQEALEAAGATVHLYETFGSYQGDWWARVTLGDGRSGWVNGSYGSCSGCDAFEAEFDCTYGERCDEHEYDPDPSKSATCAECKRTATAYSAKLSAFGAGYLDALLSQSEAEAVAAKHIEWDSDAQPMLDYIRSNAATAVDAGATPSAMGVTESAPKEPA